MGLFRRVILPAACVVAAVTGCSSGQTPAGTFTPEGDNSSAQPTAAAQSTAVAGLRSFAFPSTIQVQFQTPLPASGPQRAAVIGYENYIDSVWYAVYTHGADKTYTKYVFGNALDFAQAEINAFTSNGYQLKGTLVYYDTSVPQVYFGAGAEVESCVDASQMNVVNEHTGATVKPLFTGGYDNYQEQAAAGKADAGYWVVSHTDNYPSTSGGTAGVCDG
ncbi:MAG: hypothetical protein ABSA93_41380 [Streptosporangiaceae bacterium]|jgi:hypothetical protein